ncbi:MAG: DUF748 domain-containing protein [Desulfovibrio sp.]
MKKNSIFTHLLAFFQLHRVIKWLSISFIIYLIVGFAIVPPVAKSIAVSTLTEQLSRSASIGNIFFNPLTLSLEVEDFAIQKKDESGLFVGFKKLRVSPDIMTLGRLAPVLDELHLDSFQCNVDFYGDGKFSFSDLLDSGEPQEEDPKDDKKKPLFPFFVEDIAVSNSTITLFDTEKQVEHSIQEIGIRVPFVSTLIRHKDVALQPYLEAKINGRQLRLDGQTYPLSDGLRTDFHLKLDKLNLVPYWQYVPLEKKPVLTSAELSTGLTFSFERTADAEHSFVIKGGTALENIQLITDKNAPLFSLKTFAVDLNAISLTDHYADIQRVAVVSPEVHAIRLADGTIDWMGYIPPQEKSAEQPTAGQGGADGSVGSVQEDAGFKVDVRKFILSDGGIVFRDEAISGGATFTLTDIATKATEISTHSSRQSQLQAEMRINQLGRVSLGGGFSVPAKSADLKLGVSDQPLVNLKPYVQEYTKLLVDSGEFGCELDFSLKASDKLAFQLHNSTLAVTNFTLHKPANKKFVRWDSLNVSGVTADLSRQLVGVSNLTLTGLDLQAERVGEKRMEIQQILGIKSKEETSVQQTQMDDASNDGSGWTVQTGDVVLSSCALTLLDKTTPKPARVGLKNMNFRISNASSDMSKEIQYDLKADWITKGTMAVLGKVRPEPLKVDADYSLKSIDIAVVDPYVEQFTDLLLARGYAGLKGNVKLQQVKDGLQVRAGTDIRLDSLRIKDNIKSKLFDMKSLSVQGVQVSLLPNTLKVRGVEVDSPVANITRDKNGILNVLRSLRLVDEEVEASKEAIEKMEADAAMDSEEENNSDNIQVAEKAEAVENVETNVPAEQAPPFFQKMEVGKFVLKNGGLNFLDQGFEPAVKASVSKLNIKAKKWTSSPDARPDIHIDALVNGETNIKLDGVINPLSTPLYSDFSFNLGGLELVPLSPYAVKSIAYPVSTGRLHLDVAFKTEEMALSAENKFFIERLELGDKVDYPDAPSYPVKLGLALLQDSNGNIDLTLPISGRLDDPEFRLGGIIFKAVVTLLMKAVTSPFSLLGSMFGGGEDLQYVMFDAGSSLVNGAAVKKLETVTTALEKRPQLQLEVAGRFDPAADKKAMEEAAYEQMIKNAYYESLSRSERAAVEPQDVVIPDEEYAEALEDAYDESPFEDKPTNFIGMVADQEPEFMENFLRERIVVDEAQLGELALTRARAVREFLSEANATLTERVFLSNEPASSKGNGAISKHRVDLNLQ